jgi:hypothetical protein
MLKIVDVARAGQRPSYWSRCCWTWAAADSKAAVCSGELRLIMTGSPWSASAAAWGLKGMLASLTTCPQMLSVSGAGGTAALSDRSRGR